MNKVLDVEPLTVSLPKQPLNRRVSRTRVFCVTSQNEATKKCSQANRPISTGELNALLHLHFQPINLVFYQEPDRETSS